MRSIAFADFLIGVGILFVLEGLMFAASPAWMRRAMKSALATPGQYPARGRHRLGGGGLILIWVGAAVGVHRHSGMVRSIQPRAQLLAELSSASLRARNDGNRRAQIAVA